MRSARRRAVLFLALAGLGLAGVLARLAVLQLDQAERYRSLRERQTQGVLVREQPRMKVVFRNLELAAQSVAAESIFVEPPRIADKRAAAAMLGRALGRTDEEILPLLDEQFPDNPGAVCHFRWIERRVTPDEAGRVRQLGIPGVGFRPEFVRRYPFGTLASQILGAVNVDGRGIDGIELAAEPLLRGARESERVQRDARMKSIALSADLPRLQTDAAALILTIHGGIQRILEEELDRLQEEDRPFWSCAVALDPATGDVLGMSSRPTFDSNAFGSSCPESRRNRCVTDSYEPGSTFKPFILAALLEDQGIRLEDVIACENGSWTVEGRTIHDHHPYGSLSVQDVIAKSSNVGAVKLGLQVVARRGVPALRRFLQEFGFGEETGILLPGESGGRLIPLSRWSTYTSTSVPIGHEIAVTPLQLARAYAAFANGGYRVEPRIVRGVVDAGGNALWAPPGAPPRRILRPGTVESVRRALIAAVETGTATRARLPGYAVAGKTGTTQRYNPATRRYDGGYISSFVAFAPAEAARLCVLVVVDPPKGGDYYGGKVAAPVVARIFDRGLRLLEVPPRPEETAKAGPAQ